jgi:predicted GNAT family N-acyltransferase
MSQLTYKLATGEAELQEALEVRRKVFVREQGIAESLVCDGHDHEALHTVVKDGKRVVGSARIRFLGNNQAKLERMAVLKPYRHRGVGRQMLLFLEPVLRGKQVQHIIIHAQIDVVPFYKLCGFDEVGSPFWEAGIQHIKMRKQL